MPKSDLDTSMDEQEPSKSELKRQMAERQKLAEALSKLGADSLKTIPMDESLRDAIAQTSRIRSFEGIRRHKQYLGKLMRALSEDKIALIKKQLDIIEGPGRVETALLHRLERLRERLLESDAVLNDLIAIDQDNISREYFLRGLRWALMKRQVIENFSTPFILFLSLI